jgi:hypothetical protein
VLKEHVVGGGADRQVDKEQADAAPWRVCLIECAL